MFLVSEFRSLRKIEDDLLRIWNARVEINWISSTTLKSKRKKKEEEEEKQLPRLSGQNDSLTDKRRKKREKREKGKREKEWPNKMRKRED